MNSQLNEKIEYLHNIVFKRFVRKPYGQILDYSEKNIEDTPIPTPEECEAGMPNALSWWVSIENGTFFTGLYLYTLVEHYEKNPSESLLADITLLLNGMFLSQDVGKIKGFIARGVGTDGKSHYPIGSDDQTGPWLLSLFRVWRSPSFEKELKDEIANRITIVAQTLYENDMHIVTEFPGHFRGQFKHQDWRGSCKNLLTFGIMSQIHGGKWTKLYEEAQLEHPDNNIYNRLDLVSQGFAHEMVKNNGLIQMWINICGHLCLRELSIIDPTNKDKYLLGTKNNGKTAAWFLNDYKKFIPNLPFDSDFRKLNQFHIPFDVDSKDSVNVAVKSALDMCHYWEKNIVPARAQEHGPLAQSLFAIWIAITSSEEAVANKAKEALIDCINNTVNWEELNLCYAFVAESAWLFGLEM